ncbi:U3 snoRNP-associated protein Sof1 [Schizosaccharomyces japonicus yFS275]|uniref:DDB1- and CUL4-associated factor 13 n=1 Tax=Schizosaccharomyces japonicus (strain yFS275 / FY16936) TaxID=402676 RepID=B6K4K6_SCHJY|nr:U3 snoRNP-associated protein Sof1 [Schizosaccharomyces japonicus yFS275]EEB08413.1 U3 snoRNP-associated protein Sof1 [Schizosaccharomyces japonicus yFS275]
MKIKTITRGTSLTRLNDQDPVKRNLDPSLHPFERGREYVRALNATKMDRMFAAPFLGQLGQGHQDGVYALARDTRVLNRCASGSGDGVLKLWNMGERSECWSVKAHDGIIRGLAFTLTGDLLSCASDRTAHLWDLQTSAAKSSYMADSALLDIDTHKNKSMFATSGANVSVWDVNRDSPVTRFQWGMDTIPVVKFNHTETSVLASAGIDRTIVIYDLRTSSPLTKLVTNLRTNSISWNPMEAFDFVTASEDHNAYLYDMRNLKRALNVYKDHVSAVTSVDFSPTGQEFVTGSYDKSIRIYNVREGHSRDVYHTKRMQRLTSVRFSMDAEYIISASDDSNVRLWRAKASSRAAVRSTREENRLKYLDALRERYKNVPEVRRIARHRHLPTTVKKAAETKREELAALKRREENRRRHSKKGSVPYQKEREKNIVALQK